MIKEECYVPIWTRFVKLDDSGDVEYFPIDVHLHHTYCHATWDHPEESDLEVVGTLWDTRYIETMFKNGYVMEWCKTEDDDSEVLAVITDYKQLESFVPAFEDHALDVCDDYKWNSTDDYFDYDGGNDYDY